MQQQLEEHRAAIEQQKVLTDLQRLSYGISQIISQRKPGEKDRQHYENEAVTQKQKWFAESVHRGNHPYSKIS